MRKILCTVITLLIAISVKSQVVVGTGVYYYPSLDSLEPFRGLHPEFKGDDWQVNVKKLRTRSFGQSCKLIKLKYDIELIEGFELLELNYFIVNDKAEIISQTEPELTRNYFVLETCLRENERIWFCLDGYEVIELRW